MLEFDENGKLIRRRGPGRKRKPQRVQPSNRGFKVDDECLIKGLHPNQPDLVLKAVIVSLDPLQAKVTEKDAIFHGAVTTDGIRKAPKEGNQKQ